MPPKLSHQIVDNFLDILPNKDDGKVPSRLDFTMAHYVALIASLPAGKRALAQKSGTGIKRTTLARWVR